MAHTRATAAKIEATTPPTTRNRRMDLPPFPDASEPCVTTTPYVLVAGCVNGLRVLQWSLVSEIINTTELNAAASKAAPCGGDCAKKVELVMDLAAKNWKPAEIERVLKAL